MQIFGLRCKLHLTVILKRLTATLFILIVLHFCNLYFCYPKWNITKIMQFKFLWRSVVYCKTVMYGFGSVSFNPLGHL
jgi:hypothetical protein